MKKKYIVWISFNAFLDTDLYIVKELKELYRIEWHIIRSENDKFEYYKELEALIEGGDIAIQLHVCGKRLRRPSCAIYFWKLLKEIKKNNPDILYTSMAGAPYYIPVLATKAISKKTVLAIHNVHVPKGGTASFFFKLYNSFTISWFRNFQTFSLSQYKELKRIVPRKNVFYAPFILKDFGVAKNERTSNIITFLNFGNIRPYKRIDVLIKAAQMAYEKTDIAFKVIIAGSCKEWEKYQKLIKYDHLFDLRIMRVENEDIADLFNETDYFVAPYQDIAQSGSTIVALNYDKPIIASRLPAFEEYIIDRVTGYIVNPADVDDLADTMVNVIENHMEKYIDVVNNLREVRNERFSTKTIVNRYERIFDELER